MKRKNIIVLCMSMFIISAIHADIDPEQARIISQLPVQQQEEPVEHKESSTKLWAWRALKVAGAVGLIGFIAYNLLTNPSDIVITQTNTFSEPKIPVLPPLPAPPLFTSQDKGSYKDPIQQKVPFMDYTKARNMSAYMTAWMLFVRGSSRLLFPLATMSNPIVSLLTLGYGLSTVYFGAQSLAGNQ